MGTFENPITDKSKRKVIQYTSNSDNFDDIEGHGTHVCGTAAGNNKGSYLAESGQYSGVAPGAKIAYMDLAMNEGGLNVEGKFNLYLIKIIIIKTIFRNERFTEAWI